MKNKLNGSKLSIVMNVYRESLENEKTIQQLCDEYGISKSTYYRIIKNNNDVFTELDEFEKEQKRLLYTKIKTSILRAIEMLTQEVLSPLISPGTRIYIIHELEKYGEQIANELNIIGEDDLAAQFLRTLPPLEYGTSVFEPVDPDDKYKTRDSASIENNKCHMSSIPCYMNAN
jgi:transposase-like protein